MAFQSASTLFFQQLIPFFLPVFHIDDTVKLKRFEQAVNQYTVYTFTIDKLIDGDLDVVSHKEKASKEITQAMHYNTQALLTLSQLFDSEHQFWDTFNKNIELYYKGLVQEKIDSQNKSEYSLESFKDYALAKHAPAFIPIYGLRYLFDFNAEWAQVAALLRKLFLAMQMLDDLEDFNKDVASNQYTYCISEADRFIKENNLQKKAHLDRFKERVFYVSEIAATCNSYANEAFTEAQNLSKILGLKALSEWITQMLTFLAHNKKIIQEVSN